MSQKLKVKNHGACPNLLHFFNTIAITTNCFFMFFPSNFPSWIRIRILNADPDPGRKMNADPDPGRKMNADPDPRPGFQLLIC